MTIDILIRKIASGNYTIQELEEFRKLTVTLSFEEYSDVVTRLFSYASIEQQGEIEKWRDRKLLNSLLERFEIEHTVSSGAYVKYSDISQEAEMLNDNVPSADTGSISSEVLTPPARRMHVSRAHWFGYAAAI